MLRRRLRGAVTVLKTKYDQIVNLLKAERRSKSAYLIGALFVTGMCEVTWLVLKAEEVNHPTLNSFDSVVAGIAAAVLGGIMSVISGLSEQSFEIEDSFTMNMTYGALRIVVALIAGFVTTFMIRTGLALSFLKEQDAFGGYLPACFIGGFSERFVSKSLRQIEEVT